MRPARLALRLIVAAALLGGGGCSDDGPSSDAPLVVPDGCQPLLAGTVVDEISRAPCVLPYPSDFYLTDGRVTLRGEAKLRRRTGESADIHETYAADGASPVGPIVATLPAALEREGLAGINADPAASARPESTTILLDVEQGVLVPHYTDLHPNADSERHLALAIRPIAPLRHRARYVAALAGVRADGAPAPPAEGFRRLRDRIPDAALAGLAERFERDVFEPLARAGVARERLQLAWDFTVGSKEQPEADMLRVVELTRAWLASNVPAIQVTDVTDEPSGRFRRVNATITGPSFVTDETTKARLFRGGDGKVAQNGTTTFPVRVRIPTALRNGATPGRALAYGHGFFGSRDELDGTSAGTIAETLGAVIFGIDWRGMSQPDRIVVSDTLVSDPARATEFAERVHQGMANWMVTVAAMKGPALTLPELQRADAGPTYDPAYVYYFGASLGHILGGTLAGVESTFHRVVLNVGGGGFTQMMPRASPFATFAILLRGVFQDPLMIQTYIATLQRSLDPIDPVTWAPHVGPKVLMQIGLGDDQVPNVASYLHAHALGAKQIMPAPRKIFGLPESPGGEPGSAITLFDYGIDTSSELPEPPPANPVHEAVRIEASALRQMDAFFRPDGVAIHPCDGPCDPR